METVTVIFLVLALLTALGFSLWGIRLNGKLLEAEADYRSVRAILDGWERTHGDEIRRLEAVILQYKERLAKDEELIANHPDPALRRAKLRELGAVVSLVEKKS